MSEKQKQPETCKFIVTNDTSQSSASM